MSGRRTADTPIVVTLGAAELLATLTAVRVVIQDLEPSPTQDEELMLRLRLAERRLVLAMLVGTGFDADTIPWS